MMRKGGTKQKRNSRTGAAGRGEGGRRGCWREETETKSRGHLKYLLVPVSDRCSVFPSAASNPIGQNARQISSPRLKRFPTTPPIAHSVNFTPVFLNFTIPRLFFLCEKIKVQPHRLNKTPICIMSTISISFISNQKLDPGQRAVSN